MLEDQTTNGQGVPLDAPALTIRWNPEAQGVTIQFKQDDFRSWDFVIAVLTVALESARTNRQMTIMQNVQRQQMEAMQAHEIARQLHRGT